LANILNRPGNNAFHADMMSELDKALTSWKNQASAAS
jgi:enoyl-CoA hydratase/carnithine racemase